MSAVESISPPHNSASQPALRSLPLEVKSSPLPAWKRAVDVVGSLFLIIACAPIFLLIAAYIRLVSPGPVLFLQERIGVGAKRFVIFKFRTMEVSPADDLHRQYVASLVRADQPASKPAYESRLIYGGRLLRSLSLDELPQLFNVLIGNMSLIGPRPEVLRLEDYEPWQLRRFEVFPGISGLWQVSGKNRLTFNQMIQLDIHYIDHLSFWLDTKIAFKTVHIVLFRHNY